MLRLGDRAHKWRTILNLELNDMPYLNLLYLLLCRVQERGLAPDFRPIATSPYFRYAHSKTSCPLLINISSSKLLISRSISQHS